jgi:hypothetical protein
MRTNTARELAQSNLLDFCFKMQSGGLSKAEKKALVGQLDAIAAGLGKRDPYRHSDSLRDITPRAEERRLVQDRRPETGERGESLQRLDQEIKELKERIASPGPDFDLSAANLTLAQLVEKKRMLELRPNFAQLRPALIDFETLGIK